MQRAKMSTQCENNMRSFGYKDELLHAFCRQRDGETDKTYRLSTYRCVD